MYWGHYDSFRVAPQLFALSRYQRFVVNASVFSLYFFLADRILLLLYYFQLCNQFDFYIGVRWLPLLIPMPDTQARSLDPVILRVRGLSCSWGQALEEAGGALKVMKVKGYFPAGGESPYPEEKGTCGEMWEETDDGVCNVEEVPEGKWDYILWTDPLKKVLVELQVSWGQTNTQEIPHMTAFTLEPLSPTGSRPSGPYTYIESKIKINT